MPLAPPPARAKDPALALDQAPAPAPHPQVLCSELADGTGVLLHLETKFYYTLNSTALVVWKALGNTPVPTVSGLADRLVQSFHVERETAERDVAALLDDLLADGLAIERPR